MKPTLKDHVRLKFFLRGEKKALEEDIEDDAEWYRKQYSLHKELIDIKEQIDYFENEAYYYTIDQEAEGISNKIWKIYEGYESFFLEWEKGFIDNIQAENYFLEKTKIHRRIVNSHPVDCTPLDWFEKTWEQTFLFTICEIKLNIIMGEKQITGNEGEMNDTPEKAQQDINNTLGMLIRKGLINKKYWQTEVSDLPKIIFELKTQKKLKRIIVPEIDDIGNFIAVNIKDKDGHDIKINSLNKAISAIKL